MVQSNAKITNNCKIVTIVLVLNNYLLLMIQQRANRNTQKTQTWMGTMCNRMATLLETKRRVTRSRKMPSDYIAKTCKDRQYTIFKLSTICKSFFNDHFSNIPVCG